MIDELKNTTATREQIQNYIRYSRDPLAFLTECIYTENPVNEKNPVALWPGHREYLQFFVRLWQREKLIAVPKSRRMTMSWTNIPLALWEVLFHKNKAWAFVSKKEGDSAELVERALFSYTRIPEEKLPRQLLPKLRGGKMTQKPPRLIFDFGDGNTSKIEGYPMGADQLRQFTFSGILGDEAAFWPEAERFYSSAKPTLDGGGRMVLISSRSPGFFKKIVYDKINHKGDNFAEVPPVPVKHPLRGVEFWKNPTNKFAVMDIHYTADPEKRGEAFRKAVESTMPAHEFQREYERNWETHTGMPVYPNFRKDIHVSRSQLEPHLGLPILVGWDFGLSPAAVVCQLQGNSLKVLREFTTKNEGIKTFSPKVMRELKHLYPEWPADQYHHYIDPAGFQRAQTDARTCAQEMSESAGIRNINAGPVNWETRRSSVEHFLLYIDKDGAGLELSPDTNPALIQGFAGGYKYPDSQTDIESGRPTPVKNSYSHPHDGLQYVAWGALQLIDKTPTINIPTPTYSFAKTETERTAPKDYNYGSTIKKPYRSRSN